MGHDPLPAQHMEGLELRAIEVEFDGAPGMACNQVAAVGNALPSWSETTGPHVAHVARMPHLVKMDEFFDPVPIRFFGTQAIVKITILLSQLIQQSG